MCRVEVRKGFFYKFEFVGEVVRAVCMGDFFKMFGSIYIFGLFFIELDFIVFK